MLSILQAILFGLIQGVTELFPISSLGHSVVLPAVLNWQIDQNSPYFLTFLVATHAATSLVLLGFFWKDWVRIIRKFFLSIRERSIQDPDARLAWLLVIGTIPAGILGVLFEEQLKTLFATPRFVAVVLMINGVMLLGAEFLRRRTAAAQPAEVTPLDPSGGDAGLVSDHRIAQMTWGKAIGVGLMQCLALLPGFSRTGSTITGGLLFGLSHEDAARFSFLLATPIIGAAAFLKLPELAFSPEQNVLIPTLFGALAAGIAAYFSVRFLERYFQAKTLTPFGIYCLIAGAALTALFFLR